MSKKLFVGGLSWGTNDDSLRSAFERFGELEEVKVITDRETGRSRGFGFVTFQSDQDASNAVSEMDGNPIDGREVKVNEALERPRRDFNDRPRQGGGGNNFSGNNDRRW